MQNQQSDKVQQFMQQNQQQSGFPIPAKGNMNQVVPGIVPMDTGNNPGKQMPNQQTNTQQQFAFMMQQQQQQQAQQQQVCNVNYS